MRSPRDPDDPERMRAPTADLPLFAETPHPRAPHYDRIPIPPSIAGSPTSIAAAEAVEARGTAQRQRDRILAYLRGRPDGATEGEIARDCGLSGDSVRPRVRELGDGVGPQMGLGLIERTTATRRIPGHRDAIIWRAR